MPIRHALRGAVILMLSASAARGAVVFATDFASVTGSGTFLGAGALTEVSVGNPFLLNDSPGRPAPATRLVLTGLPLHNRLSLVFTLWVLDSWDGLTNTCCGTDVFTVRLDGTQLFSGAFRNWGISPARLDQQSPSGVATLIFGANTNLAASPEWTDSVWLITLNDIPHSATSAVFEFFASGTGWDGGSDESFGLDNVTVESTQIPEPSSWLLCAGALLTAWARVRRT